MRTPVAWPLKFAWQGQEHGADRGERGKHLSESQRNPNEERREPRAAGTEHEEEMEMEGRGLEDETRGFVYASPVMDKSVPKTHGVKSGCSIHSNITLQPECHEVP